jgi:uncharacterized Zn finger protein
MEIITRPASGLFPKPAEIELGCSCPDWAGMCKHVAAALYGVGARLDEHPELLFVLRRVEHLELISQAGDLKALTRGKRAEKTIAADALSDVFGIELDAPADCGSPPAPPEASRDSVADKAARVRRARVKPTQGPRRKARETSRRAGRRAKPG